MSGFFESQPSSHMPKPEIAPWDTDRVEGPYEGQYLDADAEKAWSTTYDDQKRNEHPVMLTPQQTEALWEQALDDAAHTGDYTPAHQIELRARLDAEKKQALFESVVRAQAELQSAASFLITEAIGEGDSGRDITTHPDYIEANAALAAAQAELAAYTNGITPEI